VLDLVEDVSLLRGGLAVGCCVLKAQKSWRMRIRDRGKSGHIKLVKIIGNSQEICDRKSSGRSVAEAGSINYAM